MQKLQATRGFTLTEVLVSTMIAGIIMAALLSSFLFIGRNLTRQANYQILEAKGREALTYLRRDFALAQSVKSGTTPSGNTVTLVMNSTGGEVTYTYDSMLKNLQRHANFGANPDIELLFNNNCEIVSFGFSYHTTTGSSPTGQISTGSYMPFSIKQVQATFTLQTPSREAPETRATYSCVSSRFLLRNRQFADGK